jgi:hypothetical protein
VLQSPGIRSCWQVDGQWAGLHIGPFSASLDLLHPGAGLAEWHGLGDDSSAVRILAVEAPSFRPDQPAPLGEAFLRGNDLIAVYQEAAHWPVLVHGQWRALPTPEASEVLAAVELVVSVRTDRLEVRPELGVCAVLPAGETLPVEGLGCLIFRPRHRDWSYVEMAYPAESLVCESAQSDAVAGQARLRRGLFARPLEKGVLLRTRVRSVFVRRENDALVAATEYRALVCADPPLGT